MKRRIRLLNRALQEVGGAEILLVEQAKSLAALGADVRIRALAYCPSAWRERLGGVPVDSLWQTTPGAPVGTPRSLFDRRLEFLLEDLARADLAISHNFPASSLLGRTRSPALRLWYCHEPPRWMYPGGANPYLAANLAEAVDRHAGRYYRRSLASPWGRLPFVGRRRPAHREADQSGVRALDGVWANSEFTRDNVRRIYGGVETDVVYPLIDLPARVNPRSGRSSDGFAVVTLSRLEWIKNLDTLIDGFALFRRTVEPRAELHVVGTGQIAEPLAAQVAELGVPDAVTLHGFLSDSELSALFARSHAFAFVPLDEPFGMVFPEAMLQGLLVLGPNHGGPLEILDGGRLGELVDPLSPEAIADGLSRLRALSHAEVDRRRNLAAESARDRFSRSAIETRMKNLLAQRGLRF